VRFDIRAKGAPVQVAWTSPRSDDAWLTLDRNGNGVVDDGSELFGNHTTQSKSDLPNGFIALAELDRRRAGGNDDGWISAADRVFLRLRLWQDRNHNGISEPDELSTLRARGVRAISLEYQISRAVDEHGNGFRYRSAILAAPGSRVGRFAYDVFLALDRSTVNAAAAACEPPPPPRPRWTCEGRCAEFAINPDGPACLWGEFGDGPTRDAACVNAIFRTRDEGNRHDAFSGCEPITDYDLVLGNKCSCKDPRTGAYACHRN
jgi:hypothetical protein